MLPFLLVLGLLFQLSAPLHAETNSSDFNPDALINLSDDRADLDYLEESSSAQVKKKPSNSKSQPFNYLNLTLLISLLSLGTFLLIRHYRERHRLNSSIQRLPGFLSLIDCLKLGWGQRIYVVQNRQEVYLLAQSPLGLNLLSKVQILPTDSLIPESVSKQNEARNLNDFLNAIRDQQSDLESVLKPIHKSINKLDEPVSNSERKTSLDPKNEFTDSRPPSLFAFGQTNQQISESRVLNLDWQSKSTKTQEQEAEDIQHLPKTKPASHLLNDRKNLEQKTSGIDLNAHNPPKTRNYLRIGGGNNRFKKASERLKIETVSQEVLQSSSLCPEPKLVNPAELESAKTTAPSFEQNLFSRKISIIED
ncbi:MAG: hypothetical protein SFT81_01635 [Candidatus Caenarcaniphilales bacterium]|nr:hypothetical protein [Candidatus Caenarcaniphilales bacterium]